MRRNVIVIGASAGGVEALRTVVAGLPAELPATVLVVLHLPSYGGSVLPAILNRAGPLVARHPVSGEALPASTVLVAPPDQHLVVDSNRVVLTNGPTENGHRPAIDVLFRSAATSCGPRVIGVVLSGVLDDGAAGLRAVMLRGGSSIVQDPADALYTGMPESALAHVAVDYVLPAEQIAPALVKMCADDMTATAADEQPSEPADESELVDPDGEGAERPGSASKPSGFSCPNCGGVLWEVRDSGLVRYRCRVGHAWSAESLLGHQALQLDAALWMALRGLEEKAALARTLAKRARERKNLLTADRFTESAAESTRAARLIRSMLEDGVGRTKRLPEPMYTE